MVRRKSFGGGLDWPSSFVDNDSFVVKIALGLVRFWVVLGSVFCKRSNYY